MNKTFALAVGLLCVAQPALADRQDQFSKDFNHKFNHLLYHPYVRYNQGQVDILYKISAMEMTGLGLLGGATAYGCAVSPEPVGRVFFGAVAGLSFATILYKAWKVYSRVPCLTFSEQGLKTESTFLFNWSQIEDVAITEVFDQAYSGHAFQPLDGYQYQTGDVTNVYAGRSLVVYGKHKTRLWSIEERNNWMPVPLNDLVDLLNFYRDRYGKR